MRGLPTGPSGQVKRPRFPYQGGDDPVSDAGCPARCRVSAVLELADQTGPFCGKLLGDLGADVVKIEPPGGDRGGRCVDEYPKDHSFPKPPPPDLQARCPSGRVRPAASVCATPVVPSVSAVPSVGEPHNICPVGGVILNRAALDNHPNQRVAVLEEVHVLFLAQGIKVTSRHYHDVSVGIAGEDHNPGAAFLSVFITAFFTTFLAAAFFTAFFTAAFFAAFLCGSAAL